MTRVDAQVVDSVGRPITGLQVSDFVLRVDGKVQPIRNFASENMPIDILLLLDVSGSMEPHVQRIADASEQALRVLAPQDRMAIMVFDTRTRVRLPFNQDHREIVGELHNVLRAERFNGGTRITHAMLDAARYIGRNGRPEARRAIVILTDDETQDGEAEAQVQVALDEANAVLSFLRAPYEGPFSAGPGGQGPVGRRGPWGSGGTWGTGGPLGGGGTTWPGGRGGPIGGSRYPGGTTVGIDASHSAGTADIAKGSGGDVMPISDASAFEDTLERLRQRYALHFYWPGGSSSDPERRTVVVSLAHSTGAHYAGSEVRYRRSYVSDDKLRHAGGLIEVSREADPTDPEGARTNRPTLSSAGNRTNDPIPDQTPTRRRVAVNEHSSPVVNAVDIEPDDPPAHTGSAQSQTSTPADTPTQQSAPSGKRSGWPRVDESKTQGGGPIVK